ncbi:bifunctional histidinol-phosphatase/imidazoleglycerol-phosphate dehydratase HisB [Carboxylicivirga caseinilyticus]|uniref:bifunctional histidinol-phosphatase/imidazoleglycerol-phosphate dehydratase HisB n=1 Tax=Carboxylicivirga caseinilyticus TaxID=3417572 RepID=UPI003D359091|nr:bifunctional histidinol-phosphatase/imidazoleglycerol-phosphate dehydratase HisB [Marinilabiliaceae bacterium A049]
MQKKKILFIDRDGTLIVEPPVDYQVDSLEKLEFYPAVFQNLSKIAQQLDFYLAMVTNQDGLGTASFPEDTFWPAQNKMMKALENEGIIFDKVHIDPTLPEENAPSRKPGTAMLTEYIEGDYDLEGSFVIGDRITDVQMAKNLGCKAILLQGKEAGEKMLAEAGLADVCVLLTDQWNEVAAFLFKSERSAEVVRSTAETSIKVAVNLDGTGKCNISTGLNFFDHMLEQIGRHSGCDLTVEVNGDLHVDEHHTMEDTAIVLGEAFKKALGDKRGIERYGFCLPMDDCLAQVAIDFGGRPWLVWETEFKREMIGDTPTEMFHHFFKSFSDAAACNLNIKAEGANEHHKIEGIFKALARAIRAAIRKDPYNDQLPSTKGML